MCIRDSDDTKLDLAAVTGVSVSARDYEGELTVKIGKVDFVNFNELLDSIGIVFYDSCNVPSTIFHGVVEGEKGGAYKLSNDVDPCEYTHKQLPSWAQRFGALGETFSLNASSRKNLDVALRVKFSGNYARLQLGLTSYSSDGSYADQNWRINFTQDDSIYDFSDGEWHTISSADEEDEDAWSFGGDNVCDLTRLLNMRLLGFRNPVTGPANTGSVLVDYMMITDRTRYEGMDNLYLYATADADGSGYVCYYDTTGGDDPIESNPTESDPTESDPAESNPAESNPAESDPTESNPAESDPTESDPAESNPDTGAALPLTAFVLLTAAAGAVVCCRKKK